MRMKQRIAPMPAFAVIAMIATFAMTGTAAAEKRPGQAMAALRAQLVAASTHATVLEKALNRQVPMAAPPAEETVGELPGAHEIGRGPEERSRPAEGSMAMPARELTLEMTSALDGVEAAMQQAKALAGGHEYLEPGIEHVMANTRRMRANKKLPADAAALGQEISIELFALANNARILEAEDDLHAASTALGKDQSAVGRNHLEAAARVLTEAQDKGAYHLEDDIATIQVLLGRMEKEKLPRETATAAVDELIGDIHEHLADLRGD